MPSSNKINSAIEESIRDRKFAAFQELFPLTDPTKHDEYLKQAISSGALDIVAYLLHHGADVAAAINYAYYNLDVLRYIYDNYPIPLQND